MCQNDDNEKKAAHKNKIENGEQTTSTHRNINTFTPNLHKSDKN